MWKMLSVTFLLIYVRTSCILGNLKLKPANFTFKLLFFIIGPTFFIIFHFFSVSQLPFSNFGAFVTKSMVVAQYCTSYISIARFLSVNIMHRNHTETNFANKTMIFFLYNECQYILSISWYVIWSTQCMDFKIIKGLW